MDKNHRPKRSNKKQPEFRPSDHFTPRNELSKYAERRMQLENANQMKQVKKELQQLQIPGNLYDDDRQLKIKIIPCQINTPLHSSQRRLDTFEAKPLHGISSAQVSRESVGINIFQQPDFNKQYKKGQQILNKLNMDMSDQSPDRINDETPSPRKMKTTVLNQLSNNKNRHDKLSEGQRMMIRKIKSNNLTSSRHGFDMTKKDNKLTRVDKFYQKTGFNLNKTITSDQPEVEKPQPPINHRQRLRDKLDNIYHKSNMDISSQGRNRQNFREAMKTQNIEKQFLPIQGKSPTKMMMSLEQNRSHRRKQSRNNLQNVSNSNMNQTIGGKSVMVKRCKLNRQKTQQLEQVSPANLRKNNPDSNCSSQVESIHTDTVFSASERDEEQGFIYDDDMSNSSISLSDEISQDSELIVGSGIMPEIPSIAQTRNVNQLNKIETKPTKDIKSVRDEQNTTPLRINLNLKLANHPKRKKENILTKHIEKYKAYCTKEKNLDQEKELDNIMQITDNLVLNKVKCFKYNYSLEETVQNFSSFQSTIQLSDGGKFLNIINRKPVEKLKHVLEADPNVVQEVIQDNKTEKRQQEEDENLHTELNEQYDDISFKDYLSSASCQIDDIQSFSVGCVSSRFWMLRKHIITTPKEKLDQLPFYSWNCITLQLKTRDVDLVIRSEQRMRDFIYFLIYNLQTIDGTRGSASKILEVLQVQEERALQKRQKMRIISSSKEGHILQVNKHKVFKKINLKFKIIIIRNKISYMAFEKGMTIKELFFSTILKSYQKFQEEGIIELDQEKENYYQQLLIALKMNQFGMVKNVVKQYIKSSNQANETVSNKQKSTKAQQENQQKEDDNDVDESLMDEIDKMNFPVANNIQKKVDFIFADVSQGNTGAGFEQKSEKRFQQYQKQFMHYQTTLGRLNLFLALKVFKGSMFLHIILELIEISKKIFIMEIEKGNEAFMPQDLSLEWLPSSFRFYDQTFNMIQEKISFDRKEFYGLKKAIALYFYDKSAQNSIKTKLGLANTDDKMKFQHSVVNKRSRKEINHYNNPSCLALQNSRYVGIDNDIEKVNPDLNMDQLETMATAKIDKGSLDKEAIVNTMLIKYCLPRDIIKSRQQFLNFRATFAAKHSNLRILGQQNEIIFRVHQWLERHIDKLYPQMSEYYQTVVSSTQKKKPVLWHKQNLIRILLDLAEQKIIKNRVKLRIKRFGILKAGIGKNKTDIERNTCVNKQIESEQLYFTRKSSDFELLMETIMNIVRSRERIQKKQLTITTERQREKLDQKSTEIQRSLQKKQETLTLQMKKITMDSRKFTNPSLEAFTPISGKGMIGQIRKSNQIDKKSINVENVEKRKSNERKISYEIQNHDNKTSFNLKVHQIQDKQQSDNLQCEINDPELDMEFQKSDTEPMTGQVIAVNQSFYSQALLDSMNIKKGAKLTKEQSQQIQERIKSQQKLTVQNRRGKAHSKPFDSKAKSRPFDSKATKSTKTTTINQMRSQPTFTKGVQFE